MQLDKQNLFKVKTFIDAEYEYIWNLMKEFTKARDIDSQDEFWIVEHKPVYTLGLAGDISHLIKNPLNIPVIKSDRGGQITFHGKGQIIIYVLIDLKRLNLSISTLVAKLESSVISYLNTLDIKANSDLKKRGVYINNKKIASIGLKVSKGCTYHGLSFNYDMDLNYFRHINVCGHSNQKITQLKKEINIDFLNFDIVSKNLLNILIKSIYS